jgi:hypothetical protein
MIKKQPFFGAFPAASSILSTYRISCVYGFILRLKLKAMDRPPPLW